MNDRKTKRLALSGMLAALILLATYAIRIPIPGGSGYVHAGDGVLLFSCALLGPSAWIVAGVSSALSDLLAGYAVYALPTFLIKGIMGFMTGRLAQRPGTGRRFLAFLLAEACMVVGYFLFEMVSFGTSMAAVSIVPNALQGISGVIIAFPLSHALRDLMAYDRRQ